MTLSKLLLDFRDSLGAAMSSAPDEYPSWSSWTYETHMEDLRNLWAEAAPRLKRDLQQAAQVQHLLEVMFNAFEAGQKDAGRKAALAIYNMNPDRLR